MRKPILTGSITMGILCAAIGALTALSVVNSATGAGYEWFLVAAPAAAFVTGTLLWWLCMVRKHKFGTIRGVFTGAIAGVIGHYVCWYFLFAASFACNATTGGCTDSLGQVPMNLFYAIPAAALFSVFSLIFYGWLTIPAGGLVGGLLAVAHRHAVRRKTPNAVVPLKNLPR